MPKNLFYAAAPNCIARCFALLCYTLLFVVLVLLCSPLHQAGSLVTYPAQCCCSQCGHCVLSHLLQHYLCTQTAPPPPLPPVFKLVSSSHVAPAHCRTLPITGDGRNPTKCGLLQLGGKIPSLDPLTDPFPLLPPSPAPPGPKVTSVLSTTAVAAAAELQQPSALLRPPHNTQQTCIPNFFIHPASPMMATKQVQLTP